MNREAEVFQQQNNVNNARLLIEQTRHTFAATLLELDHQIAQAKRAYDSEERLLQEDLIAANQYETTKANYDFLVQKRDSLTHTHEQEIALREQQLVQAEAALRNMQANLNVIKAKSPESRDQGSCQRPIDGLERRHRRSHYARRAIGPDRRVGRLPGAHSN
jgi:multidrug resistance efflux pump